MSFLPLSLIRIAVGVVGCWHEGTLALYLDAHGGTLS